MSPNDPPSPDNSSPEVGDPVPRRVNVDRPGKITLLKQEPKEATDVDTAPTETVASAVSVVHYLLRKAQQSSNSEDAALFSQAAQCAAECASMLKHLENS